DPLGGSFYLEHLTDELERQAYDYFRRIEELGGGGAAIEQNFFQSEIAQAAFRYPSEGEAGEGGIAGGQRLRRSDEESPILKIDPALEGKQIDRVQDVRARRDGAAAAARLAALRDAAARDDVNLMPLIVDAARDYVTMGEMCDAFREVWGIWRETP